MIYLVDFVKFLHQQFNFIFDLLGSFWDLFTELCEFEFFHYPGLPSWVSVGLTIPIMLALIFRITQVIPIIGGFDS